MNVLLTLGLWIGSYWSLSAEDPKPYVVKLEQAYRHARTLRARFVQLYSESGSVKRTEAGTAYFQRPGKMRWEYESPEKNLFVVDGKYAWFFVPADRTVSKVSAKQSADWRTPLALLAGEMKVSRVCSRVDIVASEQPEDRALVRLACTLRGSEKERSQSRESAYFEVAKSSGELRRVVVLSSASVRMEIRFSDWAFNPSVPGVYFHFEPPRGVAIVDGDASGFGEPAVSR
jgi:outer membrane lipoprotein carrier protein